QYISTLKEIFNNETKRFSYQKKTILSFWDYWCYLEPKLTTGNLLVAEVESPNHPVVILYMCNNSRLESARAILLVVTFLW
ncbi:MAG: hypothetical protein WCG27_06725, partial [Pseudomonadota bacterium]